MPRYFGTALNDEEKAAIVQQNASVHADPRVLEFRSCMAPVDESG
jgi:hypothetical protein